MRPAGGCLNSKSDWQNCFATTYFAWAKVPLLILTLLLNACGSSTSPGTKGDTEGPVVCPKSSAATDPQIRAVPNRLKYAHGIPTNQKCALNESISLLYSLPMDSTRTETQRLQSLLRLDSTDASRLQNWLEDRIQYVVKTDFDLNANLYQSSHNFNYPEPDLLPDTFLDQAQKKKSQEVLSEESYETVRSDVIMANEGTSIYATGKYYHALLVLDLGPLGQVPFISPRVGLLQMGPGLFPQGMVRGTQNLFEDIFRSSTLFHEARHSDGHGKSLGFMHVACPAGHTYAGEEACDSVTNGAYAVGSLLHKSLMTSCSSCTVGTLTALRILYLDIADRVLPPPTDALANSTATPALQIWDDAPEGSR